MDTTVIMSVTILLGNDTLVMMMTMMSQYKQNVLYHYCLVHTLPVDYHPGSTLL